MTSEEAKVLFVLEDPEELEDLYEEKLFEHRQFFLSKSPIEKLFSSRIKRMLHMHEAYVVLGGGIDPKPAPYTGEVLFTDDIRSSYDRYQSAKNALRKELSATDNAVQMAVFAEALVILEKSFAACWFSDAFGSEEVIVSKDPDPMEILQSIRQYETQGGTGFEQLKKLENNPPEILVHEMKRLSLLFKKY